MTARLPLPPTPPPVQSVASPTGLRSLNRVSQVILGLLAVLLLTLGVLMLQTLAFQRDARDHVAHEVDSILALHRVLEAMLDAETGQRGYLISGDAQYLAPLEHSEKALAAAWADAQRLIAGSPFAGERQSLEALRGHISAERAMIARTVALTRADRRGEARMIVESGFGKQGMDAIRSEIARIEAVEARQREQALEEARIFESRLTPILAMLAVAIAALVVLSIFIERRHAVVGALAAQADALRDANTRAELVARELNHRVKNLFAVILAIVSLTGRRRGADRDTLEELHGRIQALSLAHAASQGQIGAESASLHEVIARTLVPYADAEGRRIRLSGTRIDLPIRTVTPLGLIIHELATNAVKYGALSSESGTVEIAWSSNDRENNVNQLCLEWIECGGPALDRDTFDAMREGFGSTMLTLAARQLEGRFERDWKVEGARARLICPLPAVER